MSARLADANQFLARLWALDAVLVRAGFPAMSPWWRSTLERFFTARLSRRALRKLILRVGRRGGKSTTLCRVAVAWALYGPWHVPPGDLGVVALLSVSVSESNSKIRTLEAILTACGARYKRTSEGLQLEDRPALFRVFAATTTAVVGFTSIAVLADEVAAWRDADTGANPASEVFSYLRPTMATQPWAFTVMLSSPRSTNDYHFDEYEKGDTNEQQVAEAPTWVANPAVTEAQTHIDEPDLRVHSREYAAIPQPSVLGAFDASAIERAFVQPEGAVRAYQRVMVIDPSSGKKDTWACAIVGWSKIGDRCVMHVDQVDGIEGSFWKQVSGDAAVERFAVRAKERGVHVVHSDQRESLMLSAAFKRNGLQFVEHPWTAVNKPVAVAKVRRWLADGALLLPEHAKLRRELLAFEERVTPSGTFTFGARGGGHDDYVALLITLALAEIEKPLEGSPLVPSFTFAYDAAPDFRHQNSEAQRLRDFISGADWSEDDDDDERSSVRRYDFF